jgi:hypothetical protein
MITLKRPMHEILNFVLGALFVNNLKDHYQLHLPYQRYDYRLDFQGEEGRNQTKKYEHSALGIR